MSDFNSRDFKRPEHLEFYKLLRDTAGYGHASFYTVFEHFLRLAHAALYQPVHKILTGKISDEVEADYMRLIKSYEPERAKNFSAALGVLVASLETELHDFLGDVFTATGISNHWAGQFFTPWTLCQCMAKMTLNGVKPEAKRFTICEPAVGGGAILLAVVDELRALKFGPRQYWFEATDIDVRCAMMAYIQLTLAGAPGVVRHGDSLRVEQWAAWPTLTGAMFPHYWPQRCEAAAERETPPKPATAPSRESGKLHPKFRVKAEIPKSVQLDLF